MLLFFFIMHLPILRNGSYASGISLQSNRLKQSKGYIKTSGSAAAIKFDVKLTLTSTVSFQPFS